MEKLIIDYAFNDLNVSNPDGTFGTNFTAGTGVTGPGKTVMGTYPKALDLGTSGKAQVDLTGLNPNSKQFCFRFAFKVKGPVTSRENLFESTFLPFSIFIDKGTSTSFFEIRSSVATDKHGWNGADSLFKQKLRVNKWYTMTVAYDYDTMALFIDNQVLSVHAFPNGIIKPGTQKKLFIGTWVDGARNHFKGCLAAFQWYNGIPSGIESLLDEQRNQAEWFITYKYEKFKQKFNVGKKTSKVEFNVVTGGHFQHYERCGIMYHDSLGAAFEMHGAIYAKYKSMSRNKRSELGFLVSDESVATKSTGRKSIFSKGAIYWSGATGAVPVSGQIYLDYEDLGESKAFGFPVSAARNISGGKEQRFQGCRMYYKNGDSNAHEVHGDILVKFLFKGGVNKWGFPITHEMDLKQGNTVIGKFSEFEHCTIYWKSGVGAFEVHGDIRKKYKAINGPFSDLGFPTSDESDIPGYLGPGRINTFQKGSILWFGSYNSIKIARPFKVYIGRVSSRENEGFGMGQNDMYFKYIRLYEDATLRYNKRRPSSGDYGGHNVRTINYTIPVTIIPNTIHKKVSFSVQIYDADPGPDDHLGTYTKVLKAANAWGLRDNNGVYNAGFAKIRSLTWSVKPQIDISSLTEPQKWWGVQNKGTNKISWQKCANAFRDIDSDTEWWDITDWLDKAFYELVVKNLADGGNCYGMALEGIYARKNASVFSMPLDRFKNWNTVENEFNIKHCYQVSAGAIWWFLGQFVSGNTHDPKDVFLKSRREFNRGNHPLICIAQNYDFSGSPHCILPVKWDTSSKPWKMDILDPNFPGKVKVLTVNPDNNTFEYVSSSSKKYSGGEWSGGRFHYMPFSIVNKMPRTPVWDAILLLLAGTIIILADDAETTSIKDAKGNDLDGFGNRAKNILKSGERPVEYFVGYNGFDRSSSVKPGQIMLRREDEFSQVSDPGVITPSTLPLGRVLTDRRFANVSTLLRANRNVKTAISGRTVNHVLNDPKITATIPKNVMTGLTELAKINSRRDFVHEVKGTKSGKMEYIVKHKLSEVKVETSITRNETHKIEVNNLGTNSNTFKMVSARAKNVDITITNKIGVSGDFIQLNVKNIPVSQANALELNVKQGMGGIEVLNKGNAVHLPVALKGVIDGKKILDNFNMPLDKGMRIKPVSVINSRELTVSKIDRLFGSVISTSRLSKL